MPFENTRHPVIAIVGAGAVGGYYGGRLEQAGYDVRYLVRSDYDALKQSGWTIKSCDGDFSLPHPKVYRDPALMPKADLVIVTAKSTSNRLLGDLVTPLVKESTALLTLQNGLGNEEHLAGLFGAERVLGGMAFVCINRIAPGVIHHIDHGLIRLGEFLGPSKTARSQRLADVFNKARVKCQVLDDLRFGRWQKLVWNIPFNGLGALTRLTTDRLIDTDAGVDVVRQIMTEVVAVAHANGVRLPEAIIQQQITHTQSMGPYRTSSQIDRETGRPLEIEAIFGEPLRAARAKKVPTPWLERLYQMLRLVDVREPPHAFG